MESYNGSKYISEQIEPIFLQLDAGGEFLVAADRSSDQTIPIIKNYGNRISKIYISTVGGVNKNFERLILESKHEAVVLADQDDIWLPERLERIRRSLKDHDLVVTNGYVVDENLLPSRLTIFDYFGHRRGFLQNFVKNTRVGCCVAFKKGLLKNCFPFDQSLHAYDWLIGLLGEINGNIQQIDEPLLLYRHHDNNFYETGKNQVIIFLKRLLYE